MSEPGFPYLVVGPRGERIALYARAEMALSLCEGLGDGATIQADGKVLWRQGAEVESDDDAFFAAVKLVARRQQGACTIKPVCSHICN